MRILVTGVAGFIGFHLAKRLCADGHSVVGIDNLNDYYDVSLKEARLEQLKKYQGTESEVCGTEGPAPIPDPRSLIPKRGCFTFKKLDIADREGMEGVFKGEAFDRVLHMAAQAGVRYSLTNPHAYIQANIVGFLNILEGCRHIWGREQGTGNREQGVDVDPRSPIPDPPRGHLVYASSSSVYGLNTKMPFSVHDNVDHPISLYAATKKSTELMAHTYSHLYGLPTTGLRYFTVYGPWGRPDMALFKFTKAILEGQPIDVYNEGKMRRDFTYIDDIVEGVVRVMDHLPESNPSWTGEAPDPGSSPAPYHLYNIGNHSPVELMDFIGAIEKALGKEAQKKMLPMQPGDVAATYADVDDLMRDVGFAPKTSVQEGIAQFVEWYRAYY